MTNKTIFSAQTTNANSTTFYAIGNLNGSAKDYAFLTVYGEFDGASIQLEYQAADGSWYSTGDDAITAPCAYFIEMTTAAVPYRLALTGAGASTEISSTVYNVS